MSYNDPYLQFSADNTAKTFKFNHDEAVLARDFQKNMSETSHQMEVNDLIKAGLNPVLSANGGASAYSASGASASADSSGASAKASVESSKIAAAAQHESNAVQLQITRENNAEQMRRLRKQIRQQDKENYYNNNSGTKAFWNYLTGINSDSSYSNNRKSGTPYDPKDRNLASAKIKRALQKPFKQEKHAINKVLRKLGLSKNDNDWHGVDPRISSARSQAARNNVRKEASDTIKYAHSQSYHEFMQQAKPLMNKNPEAYSFAQNHGSWEDLSYNERRDFARKLYGKKITGQHIKNAEEKYFLLHNYYVK